MHRDGFRVALCGEGADELFCGYPPRIEVAFHQSDADGRLIRDECLDLMHRVSLQRVDRCSMRHQVETREPFLDPSVVKYALNIDAAAMVREVDGLPRGKAALRDVYDLYPDTLPSSIRDRTKVPFGEGAGLDMSPAGFSLEGALRRRYPITTFAMARSILLTSAYSRRRNCITYAGSRRRWIFRACRTCATAPGFRSLLCKILQSSKPLLISVFSRTH